MMNLKRFRVTNFRSVEDSGWIEVDDVTALIGTNESGKTNILLPLWKFNPAKEGAIVPTTDFPRKHYNAFRNQKPKPVFIRALFEVDDKLAQALSSKTGMPADVLREVEVTRRFDTEYEVDFPKADPPRTVANSRILAILDNVQRDLEGMAALENEADVKKLLLSSVRTARASLSKGEVPAQGLASVLATLEGVKTEGTPETSTIVPRHRQACEEVRALHTEISRPHPRDVAAATDLVVKNLPKFVYYSTYGNLDSEIYLPHVIANLARADLGLKEQSKARTLKVLFEFVKLQPQEILELGLDFKDPGNPSRQPTAMEIEAITEKKKQRSILLQSASTLLTKEFRAWWKQGEYRFRFEADGNHFRIWVSDDKRPEEIELEGRSTGLQWFLSFYLVFLVERADAHEGAILLLDEPGLSLHPLAQRDLSEFFDGLAGANQLLYTCHSPFLIDADRLDRARKVYVDPDGSSKVTPNLSADGDAGQRGASYAVYAALGLTVAESLLLGCRPVIVEGPSDQHYLTAIKNLLIGAGRLKPGRELVFPPAHGTKGVKAVSSILAGRDDSLPIVLVDGDGAGRTSAEALRKGLYVGNESLVLDVSQFVGMDDAEIEDLIPAKIIARILDKWQRAADVPFADVMQGGKPIVPEIEAWAAKHKVVLAVPGWKVELAKRVKQHLLAEGAKAVAPDLLDKWGKLFAAFEVTGRD